MSEESITPASISPGPVSEDDWIVHAVNIQGVFFERACRKMIEDTPPWRVLSANVPVEFPPPTDHSRGKESNLDIWAVIRHASGYDGGVRILSLLVECKKNNPEFVKWVFFPRHVVKNQRRRVAEGNKIAVRQVAIWHAPDTPKGWQVLPNIMRRHVEYEWPVADEARETRSSYRDYKNSGTKTKTANTAISEAAYQISLATQAVFLAESQHLIAKLERAETSPQIPPRSLPWVKQFFIPIIVTSAQLFTCDFNPDDIDPVSGEIPFAKAVVTERQQLLYEYPLPRHLQAMPLLPEGAKEQDDLELLNRMHILVVQSKYFPEFLQSMAREAGTMFDY